MLMRARFIVLILAGTGGVGTWVRGRVGTALPSPRAHAPTYPSSFQRQLDLHSESRLEVLRADAAAVLLDRLARDCKAEAGAGRLCRKVRVEDAREQLGRD